MPLSSEIAVLDGLDLGEMNMMSMSAQDGRIGRVAATGAEYAKRAAHNFETRSGVIDPSEGSNYSGGSSAPTPTLPLLPSSVGLADSDIVEYARVTNVLPPLKNVVAPGRGALYGGGSNYYPGGPLVVSGDPGLAAADRDLIEGGYGRAGLGQVTGPMMDEGYGRAGLGRYDKYSDFDGVPLGALDAFFGSSISIEDGRIGREAASGREYAKYLNDDVSVRMNVIDAGEGALYQGGSSAPTPVLPLMPSSVGLAGLDAIPDAKFVSKLIKSKGGAFRRVAGRKRIERLSSIATKILKAYPRMTPMQQQNARAKLAKINAKLAQVRRVRRNIMSLPARVAGMR